MDKNGKSKGTALLLSSFPVIGWFGLDKYYIGARGWFIAQFICAIVVVGLLFSLPLSVLGGLALLWSILTGGNTFLYPKTEWLPTTTRDKIIAYFVIFMYTYLVIILIMTLSYRNQPATRG